ncbi:hypothetical protein AOR13_886 [Alteromonas stellipolaris LMG 21856]|nr:hypothetical protein AOR13_886 [Alteromonas stellipolaris LMG 21856]
MVSEPCGSFSKHFKNARLQTLSRRDASEGVLNTDSPEDM